MAHGLPHLNKTWKCPENNTAPINIKNIPVTIGTNFINALKRSNRERNWLIARLAKKNGNPNPKE